MGTVVNSGLKTVTALGVEETIGTAAGPGTFQLVTDVAGLALADVATFYVSRPVLSGGATRKAFIGPTRGGAEAACKVGPPIDVPAGITVTFSIKQTGVSAKSIPWSIEKVA